MSQLEVDPMEVIEELNRQFPKELTICVQAVQIRKLQEQSSASSVQDSVEND